MEYSARPIIVEFIRSAEGGMKEHYISLVKGLRDLDIPVVAVCNFQNKHMDKLREYGAEVISFPLTGHIHPIKDAVAIFKLVGILGQYKASVLHCHGYKAGIVGRIAAILARCPCVCTFHNFLPPSTSIRKKKVATRVEEILSPTTKKFITVSEALAKEVVDEFGIPKEKVQVIYNGVELPNAKEYEIDINKTWEISKESIVVGTVARLIPSKGINVLLDAIPLVIEKHPETIFMIVGDGPDTKKLIEKARHINYGKNIIFTGYSEYIWYYYDIFDIFVLPSLSEGLGIALIEAMMAGKPAIASNTGGIPEILMHEWNGYMVNPGDSQELAEAIIYFISHPTEIKEYAKRAKDDMAKKFHIETMVNKTSYVLLKAAQKYGV